MHLLIVIPPVLLRESGRANPLKQFRQTRYSATYETWEVANNVLAGFDAFTKCVLKNSIINSGKNVDLSSLPPCQKPSYNIYEEPTIR